MPTFQVLCRIDAYADYVAEVDADSADQAAALASDEHNTFTWKPDGVAEFDARVYFTLAPDGSEIERTKVGDF
jgi:hypothetical protein